MKTQIIQLNTSDDYQSVRDKLDWSQARRILLVWPMHGKVLQRKLDLKLLKQHAISLGTQLAVVTQHNGVKVIAHQADLPVFDNILQAQNSEWKSLQSDNMPSVKKERVTNLDILMQGQNAHAPVRREQPTIRVFTLCISLLAVFVLAGFILPGAIITITPRVESQTMLFDILADPSATMINYSKGSLPTYSTEVVVNGEKAIHSSDSVTFPDQPAIGKLSFSNTSNENIIIPLHTIVSTNDNNPIRFVTTSKQEMTIEPEQTVEIEAQALKPGISGNLTKNQLVLIEGPLAASLTVTNLAPTTGGTQKSIPAPNLSDQESLRKQLLTQLKYAALDKIQTQIMEGDWIISPTLGIVETISEAYFPDVGQPGNNLNLTMEVRFKAQVVSNDLLHQLIEPIMDANTPTGYLKVQSSLFFSQTDRAVVLDDGKAHFTIMATRTIRADIPESQVTQSVLGVSIPQAVENLAETLPLADQAKISLIPGWWPRMPWLTMRIDVIQTENYENFSH